MYSMFIAEDADWKQPISGTSTLADMVKENALNTVVNVKISKQQANDRGLALTEEDQADITEQLSNLKEQIGEDGLKAIGASDAVLTQYITDAKLSEKLYDDITKDFTLDAEEFEAYFQDYLTSNEQTLVTVDADYIHTDTLEEAQAAQTGLDAGEDFIEAIKAYSIDYDAETEYASVTVSTALFPQDVVDAAFALSAGSVSDIIETEGYGCYILRINSITEPDVEELRPTQEETYITQQKQEMFSTEMQRWSGAAKIDPNTVLYSRLFIPGVNPKATPTPIQDPTIDIGAEESGAAGEDTDATEAPAN